MCGKSTRRDFSVRFKQNLNHLFNGISEVKSTHLNTTSVHVVKDGFMNALYSNENIENNAF